MKKDIAIYGAGGLGREVALLISQLNEVNEKWNVTGFFDDGVVKGTEVDGLKILGGMKECSEWSRPLAIALAMSNGTVKKTIYERIRSNAQLTFPALIHPSVNLGDTRRNTWGQGVVVNANTVFTTGIHLGNFVMVNLMCTIGHDVHLGDYSSVMPGCHISGNVKIGTACMLGTGSKILQNLTVGNQSTIGAGAVVTKDAGDHAKLAGVPARQMIT